MKRRNGIIGKVVAAIIFIIYGVAGYAQPIVYTYDIKTPKNVSFWYDGPFPIILFGTLFVVGVYLIYHYWANGRLVDDMS